MKYEGKILEYLDGSLSDSESAELLHGLSVSPEKRVILEQHLQLKDMVTSAQKPFAVPAELEQAMGRRFRAIALYNSELALGTASTVGGSGTSVIGSFFSKKSVRLAAAALLLLVFSSYLAITTSEVTSTTSPTNEGANSATVANNPTINSSQPSTTSNATSLTRSLEKSSVSSSESITRQDIRVNSTPKNIVANGQRNVATTLDGEGSTVVTNPETLENIGGTSVTYPIEMALVSSISTPRTEQSSQLTMNSVGEPRYLNPFTKKQDKSGVPILLRFELLLGQGYFRVSDGGPVEQTRIEPKPLLGLDYIASPYFSLGIEGSSAGIAKVIPSEVYSSSGNITRYVTSNTIEASNHWYARMMARFTVNPYDMFRIETSVGGGVALDETLTPLVAASLALTGSVSEKIGWSVGGSFAGTFSKVGAPVQSGDAPTKNEAMPVGYIQENAPLSTTLFSPSLTFRFGLRIKPW